MGTLRFSNSVRLGLTWSWAVALCVTTLACTPAIAVGVSAALVGGAALAARCSDPIHVTVFDGMTGLRACDAKVVALDANGSEETFSSCFYAPLPAGTWTVRAERRGYQAASTSLVVSKQGGCDPAVQTIELSLFPIGAPPTPGVPIRPLRPGEAPLTPGGLPAPGSIGVETAAPAPPGSSAPPPATSGVPSGPAPAPSASPPAPVAPPVPPAPPAAPSGAAGAPAASPSAPSSPSSVSF